MAVLILLKLIIRLPGFTARYTSQRKPRQPLSFSATVRRNCFLILLKLILRRTVSLCGGTYIISCYPRCTITIVDTRQPVHQGDLILLKLNFTIIHSSHHHNPYQNIQNSTNRYKLFFRLRGNF